MANVDVGLPIPLGNYSYLPPVQTGVNDAVEEQAMNPILAWLAGQGIDVAAEKSGIKDPLRDRMKGLLSFVGIGDADADESITPPPVQTGFQPVQPPPTQLPPPQDASFNPNLPVQTATDVPPIVQTQGNVNLGNPAVETESRPPYNQPAPPALPPRVVNDAQKLNSMGITNSQELARRAAAEEDASKKNKTPPPKGGVLDTIGDYFKSEEAMTYLVMGLNSLRSKPDQGISDVLGKRIEQFGVKKTANRTADVLLARGMINETQAEQIRMGVPVKDVLKGWTPLTSEQKRELGLDPNKFYQIDESGKIQGEGGQVINLGEDPEAAERGKAFVKIMQETSESGKKASAMSRDLQVLQALGQSEDMTSMPSWVLQMVPRGMNTSKDAYESVMIRVALAMKEAGTGAMSDRDFDRFIATAGDIAANPAAKMLSQQLLAENARIIQEKAKVSRDYLAGNITKAEANKQISALDAQPLSAELLTRLDSMIGLKSSTPAPPEIGTVRDGYRFKGGNPGEPSNWEPVGAGE
jgi:hypothetical protein